MTRRTYVIGLILLTISGAARAADDRDAVFVGTSPCTEAVRPLLGILGDKPADLMRWNLSLRPSGDYTLRCEYGPAVQGTKDIGNPTVIDRQGKWATGRGSKSDPRAAVYELDGAVALVKV